MSPENGDAGRDCGGSLSKWHGIDLGCVALRWVTEAKRQMKRETVSCVQHQVEMLFPQFTIYVQGWSWRTGAAIRQHLFAQE